NKYSKSFKVPLYLRTANSYDGKGSHRIFISYFQLLIQINNKILFALPFLLQRELVFVDYKIPPPVYSEDLFVAYFSNYQYAIADFCKKGIYKRLNSTKRASPSRDISFEGDF
ncbi:hypothetical protein, partial [Alistipes shahii]|uniref:hypothetical protein n=1 Tax=Alistipes shahii TaxID=328814 RepID=UPI003AF12D59